MQPGERAIFTYSGQDSDPYKAASGQTVEIVRPLTDEEIDRDEVGPMYLVRLWSGIEIEVFADELIAENGQDVTR